jgi:hypothetical protein
MKVLLLRNLTVEEAYQQAKQRQQYLEEIVGNFTSVELAYAIRKAGVYIVEHLSKLSDTELEAFLADVRSYAETEP